MDAKEAPVQGKTNRFRLFLFALLFVIGFVSGGLTQKYFGIGSLFRETPLRSTLLAARSATRGEVPFNQLQAVPANRLMVAVVFGQSNSANYGETPYKPRRPVYNSYQGKLYKAEDPLLGADGVGGSVWTRLGDELIDKGYYDAVVFAPLGVGQTEIARWTLGGDLHPRVLDAIRDLKQHQLSVTHLLWHQGESDAGKTAKESYKRMFNEMVSSIRRQGVNAPIYVAVASRGSIPRGDKQIQEAQQELVDTSRRIYAGPNTDQLGNNRFDGVHFSDEGLDKAAQLWLDKVKPKQQVRDTP